MKTTGVINNINYGAVYVAKRPLKNTCEFPAMARQNTSSEKGQL